MAKSPTNMQPLVHAMVNIFFVFGEGSALLRLYTKLFILNSPGWDDWAMLAVAVRLVPARRFWTHKRRSTQSRLG